MSDVDVTAAGGVPDVDELLTTWWTVSEATTAVSARLGAGLETVGGLSLPAFDLLLRVAREPGDRIATVRLAVALGLTAGGFTRLLDRLQQDGLVTREPGADRDTGDVVLTERGRDTVAGALERHGEDLRRHLLAPLGVQGLRALASLSRALRDDNR